MRKVLKDVSFVILLFKMCIILGQETSAQKRTVIDVGHGGKDSGAMGINGIQEKDVVMNIALEILRLNQESEKPLDIYMTRYSDTLISLSDRAKLAKALNVDLFVSLHCNHSDNPNARGVEVFVADSESNYLDDSIWLAFQFQAALNTELGFESRGVKFGNFKVLRETVDCCPAVLLELGFLSNQFENYYYNSLSSIRAVALVLIDSMTKI